MTDEFSLLPFPREMHATGERVVTVGSIAARDARLRPAAEILARDWERVTGRRPAVTTGEGDVALTLDTALREEEYRLTIGAGGALIAGADAHAVNLGAATLMQLLRPDGALPGVNITDRPEYPYRGLMLDTARHPHTAATLRTAVELCRFYKIRYLHLHLSDDQGIAFAGDAYPELRGDRTLPAPVWRELEQFACERGVTLIPEIDLPGHAAAAARALPAAFNTAAHPDTICPGAATTWQVLETWLAELCAVFRASPYLHLGADEFDTARWENCPACRTHMAARGLASPAALQRDFIVRMHRFAHAHGKRLLVWEGFAPAGLPEIPRDVTVMVFESLYATAPELLAAGYQIINTSWQPLYVVGNGGGNHPGEMNRAWSPEEILRWHPRRWENWWPKSRAYPDGIEIAPTPALLGGQMCSWAMGDAEEIPALRRRLAALSERLWSPAPAADFARRLDFADERFEKILGQAR